MFINERTRTPPKATTTTTHVNVERRYHSNGKHSNGYKCGPPGPPVRSPPFSMHHIFVAETIRSVIHVISCRKCFRQPCFFVDCGPLDSQNMPILVINTNVASSKIPPNFITEMSALAAKLLSKPETVSQCICCTGEG